MITCIFIRRYSPIRRKMRWSALIASCYVAFAIGTNNVANAVGPLYGAGILGINTGLILIAPLFGIGAWLMGKGTLETVGREIVPLGPVSGTLVSFVTATLLIFASVLGIPQSLVQLNLAAIFSISCVKNGHRYTLDQHLTRKTFFGLGAYPFDFHRGKLFIVVFVLEEIKMDKIGKDRVLIKRDVYEELIRQCLKDPAREVCGILGGKAARWRRFFLWPISPTAPSSAIILTPRNSCRCSRNCARRELELTAIYHSHVDSPAYPSARDIELAFYPESSYIIVSLSDPKSPVARSFRIVEGKIEEKELVCID